MRIFKVEGCYNDVIVTIYVETDNADEEVGSILVKARNLFAKKVGSSKDRLFRVISESFKVIGYEDCE